MKKFIIQTVLLIVVIGVAVFFISPKGGGSIALPFLPQKEKSASLQINDAKLQVEVADTPTKRSKGLGGRASLGENEGMLFAFDKEDKYPFWMKGLSFPLDFVWIKGTEVVDISENIQPPVSGQSDASLPIIAPKVPVDKVLEVNAGVIKKFNIKVGDTVSVK